MARKVRHSGLESRSARLKLAIRKKPYAGLSLARGVSLLYRRNKGNGAWVVKAAAGDGASYWTKAFAEADDYDDSNGDTVLTFYQAQDRAKELARGSEGETAGSNAAPVTVDRALVAYAGDLKARNANVYNAKYPRFHLAPSLLGKPVALLTAAELKGWRDGLLDKIKPASINRLCKALCAALQLAAQHDKRITNRDAWNVGLAGLPDAQRARNVVLSDTKVHDFVAAAYDRDAKLGLLVDTLAITGARPSQVVRLLVEDLHNHPARPRLAMPKSGKGGGRNRSAKKVERYSVPITPALAARLKATAKGRSSDAPLLVQSNGQPWRKDPSQDYRADIDAIVEQIGEKRATIYSLRHSSIVRSLLRNVPIRLVASLHDTSVGQIERNYSRFITEHADEPARIGLLEDPPAPAHNVVPIGGR